MSSKSPSSTRSGKRKSKDPVSSNLRTSDHKRTRTSAPATTAIPDNISDKSSELSVLDSDDDPLLVPPVVSVSDHNDVQPVHAQSSTLDVHGSSAVPASQLAQVAVDFDHQSTRAAVEINTPKQVVILPLDDFLKPECFTLWAGRDSTGLFIKALPNRDAWNQVKMQDPYLREQGSYLNVPNLPKFQLHSWDSNEVELDHEGNPILHGLDVDMLQPLLIPNSDFVKWLSFVKAGLHANPSRANPLDFRAQLSSDTRNREHVLTEGISNKTAIFWTLGLVERSYIVNPRVSTGTTRVPSFHGITVIPHRWEFERMCAFFAYLFQNQSITAQFDSKRSIAFQTRFQKNHDQDINSSGPGNARGSTSHSPSSSQPLSLGKISVGSYSSAVAVRESYFKNGYAFSAKIPVYDARGANFQPALLPDCLTNLPRWTGDIPAGAYVFVGYATLLQFHKGWNTTFYVRYVVILGM